MSTSDFVMVKVRRSVHDVYREYATARDEFLQDVIDRVLQKGAEEILKGNIHDLVHKIAPNESKSSDALHKRMQALRRSAVQPKKGNGKG